MIAQSGRHLGDAQGAPESESDRRSRVRKGGLGRGLGALIPPSDSAQRPAGMDVDINAVSPNPYQPRSGLDPTKLQQLAESIRLHGVIQPLIVRRADERDRYVLIAGERRWRAARLAGLTAVPIIVKDAAPQAMLELALVENVVRADLSPLEEAVAYRQLIEEFGLTQASVAERVGRSRVSVTNTLRLLTAPEPVQTALQSGKITEGHARALLGLPTGADQIAMLDLVGERGWNVRQTEDAVRRWVAGSETIRHEEGPANLHDARLQERVQTALGTKVALRRTSPGSGGTLVIHFYSDEQLQTLCEHLMSEELL